MLCPDLASTVVGMLTGHVEYASNVFPWRTFPDGLDVEAFTLGALQKAHACAVRYDDRHHVTPYMRTHATIASLSRPNDTLAKLRWTLDTEDDLFTLERLWTQAQMLEPQDGMPRFPTLLRAQIMMDLPAT